MQGRCKDERPPALMFPLPQRRLTRSKLSGYPSSSTGCPFRDGDATDEALCGKSTDEEDDGGSRAPGEARAAGPPRQQRGTPAPRPDPHDEKLLASYTKLADNRICVPGRPPALVPLKQPLTLADDSRGWSYPTYTHPLEPLVRAVDLMTESRSVSDRYSGCEIVTTSGNLRRLYEFCRGVLAGRGPVDAMTRMKIPGRIERFDIQWSPRCASDVQVAGRPRSRDLQWARQQ